MGDSVEIINAKREYRGTKLDGHLKLNTSGISFSQKSSSSPLKIEKSQISSAGHFKQPKHSNCLRILTNDGTVERFTNLSENDLNKLEKYISKHYGMNVNPIKMSISGSNCGQLELEGNSLLFKVDGTPAFEIPLSNVSNSSQSRSEVVTEFHQNETSNVCLVEMRFHVPSANDTEPDAAESLHNSIMSKADVIKATGGAIASFSELYCLTPRGRFDVRLFNNFLQLRGKTVDYKISYSTILRTFLLPNLLTRSVFYVIGIDPPIKQGQTRYPYLVFQFDQDDHSDIELTLNEEVENKFTECGIFRHMSGEVFDLVSQLISVLMVSRPIKPGTFESNNGGKSIACFYKANSGYLFPLERGFIFVHKPTFYFRYEELSHVGFDRSISGETKSFDFSIETKQGGTSYVFAGMMKSDYEHLSRFVAEKNLLVRDAETKRLSTKKNQDHGNSSVSSAAAESSGLDSDDEDFNSQEVSEEKSSSEGSESMSTGESSTNLEESRVSKSSSHKTSVKRKKKSFEGSEKRKKKARDPTMPKKPMSAYMLWLNENRPRIKRENPRIVSVVDLVRHAASVWNQLKDKSKWENMARIAKEEYEKALKDWKKRKAAGELGFSD